MKIVAVINQKGGVGKTTTVVSIGAALARLGLRILLIDLDPQANLTLHLDRWSDGEAQTSTDLLLNNTPLVEILVDTSSARLSLVPADTSLSGAEQALANRIGRETILREALQRERVHALADFHFVLIDCPPALGVLSANALVAADEVLVPMQAEYFSLQGMTKLMEVVELVRQRLNPVLKTSMILPCMVDTRTNLSSEVIAELRRHFGKLLAKTFIRSNVKLAEAPSFGRTIFEHAPTSNGAKDYEAVAAEFLARQAQGRGEPDPGRAWLSAQAQSADDMSDGKPGRQAPGGAPAPSRSDREPAGGDLPGGELPGPRSAHGSAP